MPVKVPVGEGRRPGMEDGIICVHLQAERLQADLHIGRRGGGLERRDDAGKSQTTMMPDAHAGIGASRSRGSTARVHTEVKNSYDECEAFCVIIQ